jgi:tetratricopeptide (TPR) repeat protein
MFNLNSKFALLVGCLALVACGTAPEKKSALSEQAIRQSERGTVAFVQGDYVRALHEYGLALRANLAIENAAGIAIERINLARVWREMSRYDQAHIQLDALFVAPVLPYPEASLAAAAALQARLYLEEDATASVVRWVERGEVLCQKKCPVAASLLLLRAQLAMREQRFTEARKLVDEVVGLLNVPQQSVELANALRLSGEIYFASHNDEHAIAQFQLALAQDQKLGLPAKIRLDLLRLAQTAEHAGKKSDAQNYADRAQSVSRATGDSHVADVPSSPAASKP